MNCANHVEVPAVAYCRTCGKPLCSTCTRDVRGVIFCEECLASQMSGTMPPPPGPGVVAPGADTAVSRQPSPSLAGYVSSFLPLVEFRLFLGKPNTVPLEYRVVSVQRARRNGRGEASVVDDGMLRGVPLRL